MSDFSSGITDYRYLKNRGYPHKAALKIVGDHYRLSKMQRNCLFRGVVDTESSRATEKKIVRADSLASKSLGVDWFNVMITVESYLKGFPVFVSDDGIARDSSSVHGSYRITEITVRAMEEIVRYIQTSGLARLEVFLDSPISHSGDVAHLLRIETGKHLRMETSISVVQSADYPLKGFDGVVASSDTIIISHALFVFDLARHVLERSFGFKPPELSELVFV
jgi:hypothetical protein